MNGQGGHELIGHAPERDLVEPGEEQAAQPRTQQTTMEAKHATVHVQHLKRGLELPQIQDDVHHPGADQTADKDEQGHIDDAVGFSWGVTGADAIAFGTLIHNGEDTNTTTGSAIDQGAATSTGWTAHLHVTLVDGGEWDIAIEDSSTGSSGGAANANFVDEDGKDK